jgi:hypothetical protein
MTIRLQAEDTCRLLLFGLVVLALVVGGVVNTVWPHRRRTGRVPFTLGGDAHSPKPGLAWVAPSFVQPRSPGPGGFPTMTTDRDNLGREIFITPEERLRIAMARQ